MAPIDLYETLEGWTSNWHRWIFWWFGVDLFDEYNILEFLPELGFDYEVNWVVVKESGTYLFSWSLFEEVFEVPLSLSEMLMSLKNNYWAWWFVLYFFWMFIDEFMRFFRFELLIPFYAVELGSMKELKFGFLTGVLSISTDARETLRVMGALFVSIIKFS